MNALTPPSTPSPLVVVNPLLPRSISEAMELANMMARAKLLPAVVQNPADAFLIINQAMRWGMDPFAVAQEVSVINGKLMFSGKIVAAAIQSSGILHGRLRYDYAGEGETRQITVTGRLRGEPEPVSITLRLRDAKTTNQMWAKQPDQQLAYAGSRVWTRRYAPEVMLGVYAPEEFEEPTQSPDIPPPRGPVVDATSRADDPPLTMLTPGGETRDAPSVPVWEKWCLAALAKLESASAVLAWEQGMEPHFRAVPPDAAERVRQAAVARGAQLDEEAGA